MGLGHLYSAVFSGKASNWDRNRNISDRHHTLSGAVDRIQREHTPKAQAMLRHSSATLLGGAGAVTQGLPQINLPSVDLGAGNEAIAQLQGNHAQQQQLNDVLQRQNLEQFKIRLNKDITDFIRQRNDTYKADLKAVRDLGEQQLDSLRQYQPQSIANTILGDVSSIRRGFRSQRETYESKSIELQNNIVGAETINKVYPQKIQEKRSTGRPEDLIYAQEMEKVLSDAQKSLPQYEELLQKVRQAHKQLRDEEGQAINFTLGESLRKATIESNAALRSLQRQGRDAAVEYQDLLSQFAAPSFSQELEKKLIEVNRSFEQFGDRLSDQKVELTDQVRQLEMQLEQTQTALHQALGQGDSRTALTLTAIRAGQQAQLQEVIAALAQNQVQQARLPYDQRTGRLITRIRTSKQTRQERKQYLVDTEVNSLEAQASFGESNFINDEKVAKLREQAALIKENLRFKVEMEGFDELAAKLNLTAEQAVAAKMQLTEINLVNLEQIRQNADVLGQQIKSGLVPAFEGFFQGLIQGGKSAGEVFRDLIGSVAQLLAQLAAKVLVKALFGGIFRDGGTVANHATGGEIRNYAQGGDVMALGLSVAAAMKREGVQAVPIVASVGEEVLSTRNGDAQFYRALRERGIWNEMKGVNNYADGGSVGSFAPTSTVRTGGRSSDINIPLTVQYQAAAGEDEVTSRTKAEQLAKSVRAVVADELLRQTRGGGILNR